MPILVAAAATDHAVHEGLFGGNFLTHRDQLGDDGTYDELANDLNITGVRFPGGAVTENHFDISNPNATSSASHTSGEVREITPFSEFMNYAVSAELPVTVVIPTRTYLSDDTDDNGDRFPDFDEQELRQFVRDTVDGRYGAAEIQAFEIGNEYWGSGAMSSVEYGRLASQMAQIIDEELSALDSDEVDIVVQSGGNHSHADLSDDYEYLETGEEQLQAIALDYGLIVNLEDHLYNGGGVNWTKIANELIMREFNTPDEIDAIDAIAAHVYSKAPVIPNSREFALNSVEQSWLEEHPDLEIYVTEWNQKSHTNAFDTHTDYGLKQAAEMLQIVESMTEHEVMNAHVWPLQQSGRSALSYGWEYDQLSAPGEMFKMMAENLPGKREIQLIENREAGEETPDTFTYFGDDELVMYIISTSDDFTSTDIGLEKIIASFSTVDATLLGVEEGELPGSSLSAGSTESIPMEEVYEGGIIQADLDSFEILELVFHDVELTPQVEELLELMPPQPPVDPPPDPDDTDDPDDTEDELAEGDDTAIDLVWLLAFLPLLSLLGG